VKFNRKPNWVVYECSVLGEWVNEWNVTSGSQQEYQDFGRAQLEVYNAASFGWAYWTLKNDRKHLDFEWNIRNHYLQLSMSKSSTPPPQKCFVAELN